MLINQTKKNNNMTSNMQKIALFGNIHQSHKSRYAELVLEKLEQHGADIYIEHKFRNYLSTILGIDVSNSQAIDRIDTSFHLALSLGGDGTFLSTAAEIGSTGIPILGINTGRLGFLADVSPDVIAQSLESAMQGHYVIEERSVIETSNNLHAFAGSPFALNEVAILKHDNSSLIEIRTFVNGELLTNYMVDGIIVCTPTGSTGYSLSVGGPIMVPCAGNFCISAIAPHSLNVRPVVVCDDVEISMEVESRSHHFLVAIDGRSESLPEGTKITLRRANYKIKVMKVCHPNFFDTLKEKMMWGADNRN